MRILVCGSRDYADRDAMTEVMYRFGKGTVVIHGGARGADKMAGEIAAFLRYEVEVYEANWARDGKRAGPMRNQRMLDEGKPDHVIAFPLADSVGTWDMIRRARKAGIPVEIQD